MRPKAWNIPTTAPTEAPASEPSPPPKFDENDPKSFAETLYQIWWRLPDMTQERIIALLARSTTELLPEYTDAYTALKKICSERDITASLLNQIKALIFTSQMITFNERRTKLLHYYSKHQGKLTTVEKEMLCGIVIHMVPITLTDSFKAPVDRVITAAISNGADFDAFQLFIDFLNATVQMVENKSK